MKNVERRSILRVSARTPEVTIVVDLFTRIGKIELRVLRHLGAPRHSSGSSAARMQWLRRWRRLVQGVSTDKVKASTKELGGQSFRNPLN